MTRNEYIANLSGQLFQAATMHSWVDPNPSIKYAIDVADQLEKHGLAPWVNVEVEREACARYVERQSVLWLGLSPAETGIRLAAGIRARK